MAQVSAMLDGARNSFSNRNAVIATTAWTGRAGPCVPTCGCCGQLRVPGKLHAVLCHQYGYQSYEKISRTLSVCVLVVLISEAVCLIRQSAQRCFFSGEPNAIFLRLSPLTCIAMYREAVKALDLPHKHATQALAGSAET